MEKDKKPAEPPLEMIYFAAALEDILQKEWKNREGSFAKAAGIKHGYLSQLKTAKKFNPTQKTKTAIAKAAGYDTVESFEARGRRIVEGEKGENRVGKEEIYKMLVEIKKEIAQLKKAPGFANSAPYRKPRSQ